MTSKKKPAAKHASTKAQPQKAVHAKPAKKDEEEEPETEAEAPTPTTAQVGAKKGAKETRELVSYSPSERKAIVKVNGEIKKAVWDVTREGEERLGCPGEPSVKAADWLAGKADLKGLQG